MPHDRHPPGELKALSPWLSPRALSRAVPLVPGTAACPCGGHLPGATCTIPSPRERGALRSVITHHFNQLPIISINYPSF